MQGRVRWLPGPGLILAGLLVTGVAWAESAPRRVDLFDTRSQRRGYAVISPDGRIEVFDRFSNRTGYGRISRDGRRIDLYDRSWNRTGHGLVREGGERPIQDHVRSWQSIR